MCRIMIGFGNQDGKLIPAHAGNAVGGAKVMAHGRDDVPQHIVTHHMSQ